MERKKRQLWLVLCVVLIVIGVGYLVYKHHQAKYLPESNLHPSKFITIWGGLDPRLSGEFQVIYQTTNKKCQVVVNRFEGVFSPREKTFNFPIKPDDKSVYVSNILLNQLKPGFCKWSAIGIDYHVMLQGKHLDDSKDLMTFQKGSPVKSEYHEDFRCFVNKFENNSFLDCHRANSNFGNLPNQVNKLKVNFIFSEKRE